MNRQSEINEFDSMYHDWMSSNNSKIKKNYAAKNLYKCIEMKYSSTEIKKTDEKYNYLYNKALVLQQKIIMMQFAEYKFHEEKNDFESTQNMDIPAFYGMGRTLILFYIESMILFARNALDIAATIYSDLILGKRTDSFNEFSKWIISSDDCILQDLKQYFENHSSDKLSVFKLLCGSAKGRALRDIIIHQTNINLEYLEYRENSDKEYMFLILKGLEPIDVNWFISFFIEEFEEILDVTNSICEKYLKANEI